MIILNPNQDDFLSLTNPDPSLIQYLAFQHDLTECFRAIVQFINPISYEDLKKIFRCHPSLETEVLDLDSYMDMEFINGYLDPKLRYQNGGPWIFGHFENQEQDFGYYHDRCLKLNKNLRSILSKKRDHNLNPRVTWFNRLKYPEALNFINKSHSSVYSKKSRSTKWDGYDFEEAIVINDLNRNHLLYKDTGQLLNVMDRYPCRVELRCSSIEINSPFIYIISDHDPEELWSGNDLDKIKRRLTSGS